MHRPLLGTEARFIRLQPDSRSNPIKCDLVYLPPSDVSCYVSLSYCWGDPNVTEEIYLNDSPFQITVNLFAAMQQLRDFLVDPSDAPKVFRNKDVLFWIDALCIDQFDLEEKTTQIPRMGQIYGLANLVVAWLGENGIHDGEIGTIMAMGKHKDKSRSLEESAVIHFDSLSSNEQRRFTNVLEELLERNWFRRVWVVQEIILAREDPIYLAGSHWCTIQDLYLIWGGIYNSESATHLLRFLHDGYRLEAYIIMRNSLDTLWTKVQELVAVESAQAITNYGQQLSVAAKDVSLMTVLPAPMMHMLRNGRLDFSKDMRVEIIAFFLNNIMRQFSGSLQTSLPHDQIYGLLSLTKVGKIPKELEPDYTIPFPTVYHTYAKAIIQHEQDLSILPRVHNRLSGVPSWVPDFRSTRAFLDTCPIMNSVVQIVDDGKVCITEGVHLGEIILATTYKPKEDASDTEALQECLYTFDKFLQDVCTIQNLEKEKTSEEWFNCWFNDPIPERVERLRHFYDRAVSGLQSQSPFSEEQFDRAAAAEFMIKVVHHSFVLTSSGLIARLTRRDESGKKGDILSMMKGTNFPYLLRPSTIEGGYTFIGGCHLLFGKSEVGRSEEYFAASKVEEFHLM